MSSPLLTGPLTTTVWIEEGARNACQEAEARGDPREPACNRDSAGSWGHDRRGMPPHNGLPADLTTGSACRAGCRSGLAGAYQVERWRRVDRYHGPGLPREDRREDALHRAGLALRKRPQKDLRVACCATSFLICETFYSVAEAKVLIEASRGQYNTSVRTVALATDHRLRKPRQRHPDSDSASLHLRPALAAEATNALAICLDHAAGAVHVCALRLGKVIAPIGQTT